MNNNMEEIQATCSAELMDQISFIDDTKEFSKKDLEIYSQYMGYYNE